MSANKIALAYVAKLSRIARQTNITSKIVSPVKVTGIIPGGFPYNAFNGQATLTPHSMNSLAEAVSTSVFFNPHYKQPFMEADKVFQEGMLFVNVSAMEVDDKLYDLSLCKAPLRYDFSIVHLGKTSIHAKTSFYLEGISNPLFVSRVSRVFVCNKTRAPKPTPDWWVKKYKSSIENEGDGTKPVGKLELKDAAATTTTTTTTTGRDGDSQGAATSSTECQVRIVPSDCDGYHHTNWSNYIRYCHDALGHHQMSKQGRGEGLDLYFGRRVRCFTIQYRSESSMGDVLTVTTSPAEESKSDDAGGDNAFNFRVENESKALVCQSKIEYYPQRRSRS